MIKNIDQYLKIKKNKANLEKGNAKQSPLSLNLPIWQGKDRIMIFFECGYVILLYI